MEKQLSAIDRSRNIPKLRFPEFSDDWKKCKIGDTFKLFNGYAFSSSDSLNSDGALWVKIADVGIDKMKTDEIEMTPDNKSSVKLSELNKLIAEQKGITVEDLAVSGTSGQPVAPATSEAMPTANTDEKVLDDATLAAQYRSQADALYKEAKSLREQAEELVPTKRKTKSSAKKT